MPTKKLLQCEESQSLQLNFRLFIQQAHYKALTMFQALFLVSYKH